LWQVLAAGFPLRLGGRGAAVCEGKARYPPGAKTLGDRRLRPRGAEGLGAFAGDGGRLGTESSVPAFSRSGDGRRGSNIRIVGE
jgi:hypothetical protein